MHNWLTTPLEYIIRDYIGFMSEKEHAQTNYYSNKQCWTEGRRYTSVAEDLRPTATVAEV